MDAGEKRVNGEARDELDRISALPLHLKESILERLPIKDAMRTSIWSSSWRYCWIGMQSFDLEAMGLDTDVEVFHKTIDRILLLHPGQIHFFTFLIPDTGNYLDVNLSDWFLVLSKKGIRCIEAMAYYTPNEILMPKSLFQCGDLRRLDLYSFQIVPPPNFAGFNNLVRLLIDNCKIASDRLGSLISHCPLLEYLWLVYTCRKYRNQPLIIDALNLKGLFFTDNSLGTIIFQNVPKLSYASFEFLYSTDKKHKRPSISWDFICSLSGIRQLHFQILLLGPVIGKWPRCLPMRLENLTYLTLSCVSACVEDNLRVVFCFLRSSPCLQVLYIKLDKRKTAERSIEDAVKWLETELVESSKLSNLSIIAFTGMNWLRPEIMLMKVMLSRCSNLKSLRIVADGRKFTDDFIKQMLREFEEIPNKDKLSYY